MKGIILAGGSGTRLLPMTRSVSKQLLNVYDKPMIYYPLVTLMQANIREILIISKPEDMESFKKLLGDGRQWGLEITYKSQPKPSGIAEAFLIGEDFIDSSSVCLILGDNIFYGSGFDQIINFNKNRFKGARIVSYRVPDPQNYGVIEYNGELIKNIIEKPSKPKSNEIITGIYFYDNDVVKLVKKLKPSKRNELEITDLNNLYLNLKKLKVIKMTRGMVWLDLGSFSSLLKASQYVSIVQERQNIQIGCPEEITFKNKWISKLEFKKIANKAPQNSYGDYLRNLYRFENIK